jgi:ABC-type Mn2+/Zn2+ transport system ATPase subunit
MDEHPLVDLRQVAVGYGARPFLEGIGFSLRQGDFFGLVGPNGAGKSTLLRAILGVLRPHAGEIVRRPGLHLGYVPQRMRIDPIYPLTALEVVRSGGMGPKKQGQGGGSLASATRQQALVALERLGMTALANRPLRDLSGGQQQRVLIARALVRSPDLLILDEPTAGMDIPSERELLDFITDLNRQHRTSVLLVVHQIGLVAGRCSHLAIINKDLPLFACGAASQMLTSARLSDLYGHPIEVTGEGASMVVRAAGREEASR